MTGSRCDGAGGCGIDGCGCGCATEVFGCGASGSSGAGFTGSGGAGAGDLISGGATLSRVFLLTLTFGAGFAGSAADGGEYIQFTGRLSRAISSWDGWGRNFGAKIRNASTATCTNTERTARIRSDFASCFTSGSISRLASPVVNMSGSTISRSSGVISGACSTTRISSGFSGSMYAGTTVRESRISSVMVETC
jgi:hypothetical protein